MPRPGSNTVHPDLLDAVETVLGTTRPEPGHLERSTRTTSTTGGQTVTWAAQAATSVRVAPESALTRGAERRVAEQLTGQKIVVLVFPPGTDVRLTDRFVTDAGRTFEVNEVFGPTSYEAERRALATELHP